MMRSQTARIKAIPVRVKPVTAAVATALGSLAGQSIAVAAELPDELVVTATRRDSTVQEVPYSIAAIGENALRDFNIDNLSGIAQYTAGLSQVDQGARDGNLLIIRGLNADSINSPEFLNNDNDRVSTYYGETPVYINLLPIDVQRVEILRGPQGTIYGARSLSGTVRVTPNKPDTAEFTVDAHVGVDNTSQSDDNGREADVVINAPLIEDTLALRALLGYKYEAGYIDYNYLLPDPGFSCVEPGWTTGCSADGFLSEEDANYIRTRSAGASLLWTPTDELDVTLSWRQQDRSSGGRNINSQRALRNIEIVRGIDLDNGRYVSGLRYTEPNSRQNDIYNLEITWDNALGELVSSTSVTNYKADGRRDQTDFLLDQEYGYEDFPDFSAFSREQYDDRVFTQEFRLVSDNEGPINYLLGAWLQDSDYFVRSREFSPFAGTTPTTYDNKTFDKRRETALFGEVGFDVTDNLNLLVGARWFDYEAKFRDCTTFGGDVDDPANCTPNFDFDKEDDNDVLGKFTASLQLADNIKTYATFSQGYSTGKVNNGTISNAPRYVEPERTDNYEVGLKGNWLDNSVRLNAALFLIDWKDIQLSGFDSAPPFTQVQRNVGEAESQGLELDLEAQLTDNLLLAAGYAYTDAELTTGCNELVIAAGLDPLDPFAPTDICGLGFEEIQSGDRLPGSPEHQGYLRATYFRSLSSDVDFRATYGVTHQSDVLTKVGVGGSDCCRDDGERLGGFTLHNVSASIATGNVEATLYVDNLTNKYAVTGVREDRANIRTVGANDVTVRRYFENVIRPRTVGIDLRIKVR